MIDRVADVARGDQEPSKTLIGREGWLYLQNDANRAVDQYLGNFPLSDSAREMWVRYFSGVRELQGHLGFQFVQVFAPSKETVYEQYYPHFGLRTQERPIDTVISLAGDVPICFPWAALQPRPDGFDTYDKGDTHWNSLGAAIAGAEAMKLLGREVTDPYAHDYYWKVRPGDLDSKLEEYPVGKQLYARFLEPEISFDSELVNRGRLIVLRNPDAPGGTLVIFGDSFGNRMQLMLRDSFRRIVYVHGHSIESEILRIEKPDYVLAEMAERFVVNPPSDPLKFSILSTVRTKTAAISEEEAAALKQRYLDAMVREPTIVKYLLRGFAE